ncbi:hypothetical protein ACA910_009013 [Epithemia clementina (nom. ined.)]
MVISRRSKWHIPQEVGRENYMLRCRQHHQPQLIQTRQYLFLPTSLTELQLIMHEVPEPRTLSVKLRSETTKLEAYNVQQFSKIQAKNDNGQRNILSKPNQSTRVTRGWCHLSSNKRNRTNNRARCISASNKTAFQASFRSQTVHSIQRGQRRRLPRLHRYSRKQKRNLSATPWKAQKQHSAAPLQSYTPSLSTPLSDRYSYSTRRVPLYEYSKDSWFDSAGRPIASRDDTGRFVNPWMSQSTNGVQAIGKLIQWRLRRLSREWKQYGLGLFLPTFFRSGRLAKPVYLPSTAGRSGAKTNNKNNNNNPLMLTGPLLDPNILRCTLIGHSTCFVQKGNVTILTDPIFSHRASPFQNTPIGVARDFPPAYSISDLPNSIDCCLISHDHYDHLDKNSVLHLRDKVQVWVVPVGIGTWLQDKCGIPPSSIVELSWWDSVLLRRQPKQLRASGGGGWSIAVRHSLVSQDSLPQTEESKQERCQVLPQSHHHHHPALTNPATRDQFWVTAFPTQHWSSRTFFDRCYRLWASFVVWLDHDQTFYFAGDTGLPKEFPLFEQIADYVGRPIDLAAIPIGAYSPRFINDHAHIDPYEAVQIHKKLQCRQSMAIHHSSFPLGEELQEEPAQLLYKAAKEANVDNFAVVPNGGSVSIGPPDF